MPRLPEALDAVAAAAWSDREPVGPNRAAELAKELGEILAPARAAAAGNAFNDEPYQFGAVLAGLAAPEVEKP